MACANIMPGCHRKLDIDSILANRIIFMTPNAKNSTQKLV